MPSRAQEPAKVNDQNVKTVSRRVYRFDAVSPKHTLVLRPVQFKSTNLIISYVCLFEKVKVSTYPKRSWKRFKLCWLNTTRVALLGGDS